MGGFRHKNEKNYNILFSKANMLYSVIQSKNMLNEEEDITKEMYSKIGFTYNYDRHPKTEEAVHEYFSLPGLEFFLSNLQEKSQKFPTKVLDIGSGIGVESFVMKDFLPNTSIYSLEYSTVGSKSGKDAYNLDQIQASALNLPYSDSSFDGIHSKDMYIHIKNKENFFSELARVLHVGGELIIVSAHTAYTSLRQVPWDIENTILMAEQAGFKLVFKSVDDIKHDDWYPLTKPDRVQLVFRKTNYNTDPT